MAKRWLRMSNLGEWFSAKANGFAGVFGQCVTLVTAVTGQMSIVYRDESNASTRVLASSLSRKT